MSDLFGILPGLEVPVAKISSSLANLWSEPAAHGRAAPASDDVKATQVNFVLHLGFGTTPEDALAQWATAVTFSSRYPSRVVVLCPRRDDGSGVPEMRAKIYGECFLGKSKGDARCCEFVILDYSFAARRFLESQVSICLSADLPLYYWVHRFSATSRLADYQYLLRSARRLIFDTASAPEGTLEYPWPNPAAVRDLAYARMLPVRQSIGQFLSRYQPSLLATGLREVVLSFEEVHAAEGRALLRWVRSRLADCGPEVASAQWTERLLPARNGQCFGLEFVYADGRRFSWQGNCHTGVAAFRSDLGDGIVELPSHIRLLEPAHALAEAMFF